MNSERGRQGSAREGPAWAKAWRCRSVKKLRSSAELPVGEVVADEDTKVEGTDGGRETSGKTSRVVQIGGAGGCGDGNFGS